MSALFYSDEAAARIASYLKAKREMHAAGATHKSLEEARTYAVEALTQILLDNDESTGYAAFLQSIRTPTEVA